MQQLGFQSGGGWYMYGSKNNQTEKRQQTEDHLSSPMETSFRIFGGCQQQFSVLFLFYGGRRMQVAKEMRNLASTTGKGDKTNGTRPKGGQKP